MRRIAILNQKGGVGKTSTAVNLSAALARMGQKVCVIDLDPQAHASLHLGVSPGRRGSIYDVLSGNASLADVRQEAKENLWLVGSHIDLAATEVELAGVVGREVILRDQLENDHEPFDFIIMDCPPSLGVLTVAALTAADGVLIPLQCETLSHRGVGQLLDTVHDVRRFTNRALAVWGVLPTLYDGRTTHARTVLETISETYQLDVIEPPIPKTIKFAEAPAAGRSILRTSRTSKGAVAYRAVAANLVKRAAV